MTRPAASAVVGVGTTPWYRRGQAPVGEQALCIEAVTAACEDAGVDPATIDGFVSYGPDANDGSKLAPLLGVAELRWSSLVWGGGGGGVAGAISVTGLKPRDWGSRLHELGARVRSSAQSLSRQLGYSGG